MCRYIGACGRVAVIEGALSPLSTFRETSWAYRADLASQVVRMYIYVHIVQINKI